MELQEAIQLLKTYIEKNESKHDKFVLGMAIDTVLKELERLQIENKELEDLVRDLNAMY